MLAHATTQELPLIIGSALAGALVTGIAGLAWAASALGRRRSRR